MKTYSKKPWWYREDKNCQCFGCKLISTPFGKERRALIMDFLDRIVGGMSVNRKHHPQVSKDPDLKRLLKQGKIKASVSNEKVFKVK